MPTVRVLHLITQLEPGGAQGSTIDLLRMLDSHRYHLTLATAPGGPLEDTARAIPGLRVQTLPSLVRPIHPWRDAVTLRALMRFMRTHRFDLVHTHSSKAGILGRWAAFRVGTPVICHTIHGFGFHPYQPTWLRRTYETLERLTAHITTRLIPVSVHTERTGLARRIGSPDQYHRIAYGIDMTRFHRNGLSPSAARLRLGLQPDAPTIGMVACFKPQKGIQDFLTVCARVARAVPNLQCVLVGDGELRTQIERQRRALGLEQVVRLLGWQRDIPSILTALDVFVLTSQWEGLPIAVLEAQAMGVPVVVTDTGGVRDCVEDGVSGCLVPVHDVDAASQRVLDVLRRPDLAHRLSAQAQASVSNRFTIHRMVQDTEQMYSAALHAAGRGGE